MLKRSRLWHAVGLFLALLALYAVGACRTIYVGDSGELVAAVHTLGIPHPSGYPLYVLLGKLWTVLLPLGSVAFRMSMFSAVFASAAAAGLYLLGRSLGLTRLPSLFAALLLGFSPSFWSQANIQRVYSLNAFFLVAALTLATRWWQTRRDGHLISALFVATLGSCNHTFMGVFGVALVATALIVDRGLRRRFRTLMAGAAAAGAGLLPYLYLPLRSRADPRLDWGDPETLGRWVGVILRREAWERAWIESPSDLLVIVADYLRGIAVEFLWIGALPAVVGIVAMRARQWPALLLMLTMAGNLMALALHGSRADLFIWHRYYIPSFVVAALLAGLGVQVLLTRHKRWMPAVLLLPTAMLLVGFPHFDRSRFEIAEDFSRALLDELPPGAHLSASDDNILFVLIYLQLVEGERPDIDLILQGVGRAELPPLRFDPDTDPLFFTHHPNWELPDVSVVPTGLTFAVRRAGRPPRPVTIRRWELAGEHDPKVPKDYLTQNLVGHFHYMLGFTLENRDWPQAEDQFSRARRSAPANDVLFYNLGLIYARNGLFERSLESFERSWAINPRHIATRKEVRASDRIAEARHELERLRSVEAELQQRPELKELDRDSAAYHSALSRLLAERGMQIASRGHNLIAREHAARDGDR